MFAWHVLLPLICLSSSSALTYYDYYSTNGSFATGLTAIGDNFQLNGKDISIYSGAFHYFRVHPAYWRDTLKKLRAAGLNTVETYMPWNLHNPRIGEFDFGSLGEDMSEFLDIRYFIQIAQEEDLFVILRPGPYICSEWDFGGLPSWLLRDPIMMVRSYYEGYRNYVEAYYDNFAPLVNDLIITKGGPIIAVQIENEFGAFGYHDHPRDTAYLEYILNLFNTHGFAQALYFTSDSPVSTKDWGSVEGVLMTANFQTGAAKQLNALKTLQPDRPLMVMEFWTGWFDHWVVDDHATWSPQSFVSVLNDILGMNSSVNLYMFIGGSNFGFMAGANKDQGFPEYKPTISSYDYDAPLTEAGDYTEKYDLALDALSSSNPLTGIVDHPAKPPERTKMAYGSVDITQALTFGDLANQVQGISVNRTINMEALDINGQSGQSYGYTLYTTTQTVNQGVECTLLVRGHIRDMAQVLVGDTVITEQLSSSEDLNKFGFWPVRDGSITFTSPGGTFDISFLVENLGRVNYGKPYYFKQMKGLWEGQVLLNGVEIDSWQVKPLELKKNFVQSLTGWQDYVGSYSTPAMYRGSLSIADVKDTFVDMSQWGKGVFFVNGFNLGRYWSVGPTQTMYIPAPLLIEGLNEFVVFEQYEANGVLSFIDYPILGKDPLK